MAELETAGLNLQWGRKADGRLTIGVAATVPTPKGPAAVPLHVWTLSAEEELALKAALSGVVVANGHAPALL